MIEEQQNDQQSSLPWQKELKRYKDTFERFTQRGRKITDIYIDQQTNQTTIDSRQTDSKFNILWANIQSLKPAAFSRIPKPEVSRRFKDKDPVARTASQIIERCLDYEITQYGDYNSALSNAIDDRLITGRGTAWVRYDPVIEQQEQQISPYNLETEEQEATEPLEVITSETTPVDFVFWEDFAHSPARTWEELTWCGRRVYMTKEEGEQRFGKVFAQVPLMYSATKEQDKDQYNQGSTESQAEVWEIWDKSSKKVYWVARGFENTLDIKDDPLELCEFFPCPKPLYATLVTRSLIPTADYALYQDQAEELNEICQKIRQLTKSLAVKGIYAADDHAIKRLIEAGNNEMIPVVNWMSFAEKGGIAGAVQFMPLQDVAQALGQLYVNREQSKQVIYEITGISDIIRGASQASETATAQNIKSQYASLRLSALKNEVSRFARDLLRIKAEIMCTKYQPQTLIEQSGIMHTGDAQYVEQALQLLANEPLRNFTIDIETDSLVELDEEREKSSRVEFLGAASSFIEKSAQAVQMEPKLAPLLSQMLLFGIRSFRAGRELEGAFENFVDEQAEAAKQPSPPPQPSPEELKIQSDEKIAMAEIQAKIQIEQMRIEAEQKMAAFKAHTDAIMIEAGMNKQGEAQDAEL